MAKKTSIARSLVTGALFAVPAFLLVPIDSVSVSGQGVQVSWAQAQAQDDDKPKRRTRRAMAISESVNKRLARVSELLNPEEEGAKPDLQGALREAQAIDSSRWNEYEQAQLWNMMGGIYVQLEQYEKAIEYYERYVQTESVPEANMLNVSYYLAQLYLATENYDNAIRLLEQYIARSEIVGADHYYKLGQAYYMAENLDKSLPNIDKAVQMYEDSDRIPPEGLYQYQMSLYHGKENYPKVISVLEKLVRHYPKLNHWRTLASVYGVSGRPLDQLHAYDTIYQMDGLQEEKELRLLASLYLEQEYPYKGAKILDKGVEEGKVEKTSKNLELLAGAWSLAKEMDKSIPVLAEAASKSDDGELFARLSQLYLSIDDYQKAVDAGREALNKKGLKKPANVHLYMGMSLFNLEKYEDALKSFREARKDKSVAQQANTWIRLVESEQARVAKLQESA
ncbi:tetratricopeptide repeat protein [Gilvimarinus sp. F26214L]|uniref:tetratricopeptide repeat protein n=1 Tax=Gilvimarinus sp. DZF01 TaxID=3461371 RepID=UPI0040456D37